MGVRELREERVWKEGERPRSLDEIYAGRLAGRAALCTSTCESSRHFRVCLKSWLLEKSEDPGLGPCDSLTLTPLTPLLCGRAELWLSSIVALITKPAAA